MDNVIRLEKWPKPILDRSGRPKRGRRRGGVLGNPASSGAATAPGAAAPDYAPDLNTLKKRIEEEEAKNGIEGDADLEEEDDIKIEGLD